MPLPPIKQAQGKALKSAGTILKVSTCLPINSHPDLLHSAIARLINHRCELEH